MILDLQKGGMGKRISAFLFDTIISAIIAVLFLLMFSLIFRYDSYFQKFDSFRVEYEEKYDIDLDISVKDYDALSKDEQERYKEANTAFAKDEQVTKALQKIMSLTVLSVTLSLLLTAVVWEFIIPLILKNGQTVGKKIFGLAVMRVDGVKITTLQLFVRSILGKYTLETMIPAFILSMLYFGTIGILGSLVLIGILILQCVLLIVTKTRSLVHDVIAATVVVDFSSQMIFDTAEDLMNYKKGLAAKEAEKRPY